MTTVPAHFTLSECKAQCSKMTLADEQAASTTDDATTNDDDNNKNNINGETATATNGALNYWKTRLRSRMAASRRMSTIDSIAEGGRPLTVPMALRRRASVAAMNVTAVSSPKISANFIADLPNPELKHFTVSNMTALEPTQEVLRVPSVSLPLESFLEAHSPFSTQLRVPSKRWQTDTLSQYFSPKFFFALHALIVKIQKISATLNICNRSLMDLRILVNLLLILSIFSQGVNSALLKSNCKKVGYQHIIDESGCDLVAVYLNRCSGYCTSFSFPDPHQDNKVIAFAKCCRMTDVELIDVKVNCGQDGGVRTVKVPSARECGCFDCAA